MATAADSLVKLSGQLEELVTKVATSVVAVHARDGRPSSGVILRPGVVITAEETVERDDDLQIGLPDGQLVPATLAGRDPSTDVAVLTFDAPKQGAVDPTPSKAGVGGLVVAVGRSTDVSAELGIISSMGKAWRSSLGGNIDARIRLDLSLSRIAEGGALVDAEGRLIGMPVFGPWRRVIAIPTSTIVRAVERILAHGSVRRGYIGIGVQPVELQQGKASMVTSVDPEGPAAKAGVILGDVVTRWNGDELRGPRALVDRLSPESVGTVVDLGISRAGNAMSVKVTVAPRPKD